MRDKWIEDLFKGHIEIVLPELTITGESLGEMKGSGRITWTPATGVFLNATTEGGTSPFEMFVGAMLEPSTILPDTSYVSIEGRTQDQRVVTCKRVYIDGFQSHTESKFVVWNLPLPRITMEKEDKWDAGSKLINALMGPSQRLKHRPSSI